jgi:hypothetical protein
MTTRKSIKKHSLYTAKLFSWKSVRDAVNGSDFIKRANELYLPMPSGFLVDDTASSVQSNTGSNNKRNHELLHEAPFWHNNPAYMAYLQRARFPEIAAHTLRGLIGVATKKKEEIELPSQLSYLEENASGDGTTLKELFVQCLSEVLQTGKVVLIVDINEEENLAFIKVFRTESNIDWNEGKKDINILMSSFLTVSNELDEDGCEEDNDGSEIVSIYSYKAEDKGQEVKPSITKYVDGESMGVVFPSLQGKEFDEIPVYPIGSINNDSCPDSAPLLGLVNISLSIYTKDADLSQAQHMTCNPNLVITGADNSEDGEGVPNLVGSTIALLITNPDAKVFYPKTDTNALDHILGTIVSLFEEASNYGASLLGSNKKSAESTDTVKIRQGAQGATLVGVVDNVVKGMNNALKAIARISGASEEKVLFNVKTDFSEREFSSQMISSLSALVLNGLMSRETLLKLLMDANLGDKEEDVQVELARILSEGPL